jgi:phosphoglycolate phosphatase
MHRPDLVLFDLDGTLVDSLPDIAGALNHCLARARLSPLSLDVVATLVGEGVGALAARALALQEPAAVGALTAATLAAQILDRYLAAPRVDAAPYPGFDAALSALARAGCTLGIITNKTGTVARALVAALGWSGRFHTILGDGDGHPRKPSPGGARVLLTELNLPARRALVVGDGLPDLALGRALGCAVAAVTWGYTPRAVLAAAAPDYILDAPDELLEFV